LRHWNAERQGGHFSFSRQAACLKRQNFFCSPTVQGVFLIQSFAYSVLKVRSLIHSRTPAGYNLLPNNNDVLEAAVAYAPEEQLLRSFSVYTVSALFCRIFFIRIGSSF
jgi:hypothetical protein